MRDSELCAACHVGPGLLRHVAWSLAAKSDRLQEDVGVNATRYLCAVLQKYLKGRITRMRL